MTETEEALAPTSVMDTYCSAVSVPSPSEVKTRFAPSPPIKDFSALTSPPAVVSQNALADTVLVNVFTPPIV